MAKPRSKRAEAIARYRYYCLLIAALENRYKIRQNNKRLTLQQFTNLRRATQQLDDAKEILAYDLLTCAQRIDYAKLIADPRQTLPAQVPIYFKW